MIDYQVFIDFQHPEMIRVPVVQGDTESRRITFVMFNGSAEYNPQTDLDTTLTVALSYLKPDGTGGQYDTMPDGETPAGSLSGNVCVLRLAPQTMSAAGLVLCNLVLFNTQGVTLQTFPFVLDVKRSAGMEITSQDYYNVKTIEGVSQSLMHMVQSVNNATPDQHGNVSLLPWQLPYNGVVGGQQVGDVEEALDMLARMQAEIISQEIKDALINCFMHVAWTDQNGQAYVDALEQAMRSKLVSISAVFSQGTAVIYDTDDIETLRQYLTVTALYSDTATRTVTAYTLRGTLTEGTSTITVSYGGKTATFNVNVTHKVLPDGYKLLKYIYGDGNAYWGDNSALNIGDTVHVIAEQTAADTSVNRVACGTANSAAWVSLCAFFSDGTVGANYGNTYCKVALQNVNDGPVEFTTRLTSSAIEVTAKNQYGELQNTAARSGMVAGTYFRMFWNGSATSIFKGRIYFSEHYNSSMVALKKMYPCQRESDNAVGLYDVVSNSFHQSETSTQFIAGPAA